MKFLDFSRLFLHNMSFKIVVFCLYLEKVLPLHSRILVKLLNGRASRRNVFLYPDAGGQSGADLE